MSTTLTQSIWGALKAQPMAPRISGAAKIDHEYRRWRMRTMVGLFLGYAVFYFCRKNLSSAQPAMMKELGFSKTEMGMIWSALYLSYGVSKMVNGVIGDRANPRYFMAIGLFLSAVCNLFFGWAASLTTLAIAWALNGWFQGMGWPACARGMSQWFSASERGRTFGVWNISHQVGGGLILILAGYLTQNYGWRYSMWVPAVIGVFGAAGIVWILRDTPESMGLPSIEQWKNDHEGAVKAEKSGAESVRDILFKHVLNNRQIWFLSLANFFVYLVRYGAMDWAPTYLVEVKHSSLAVAAAKTSLFEFLGIAGTLVAGYLIDTRFRRHRHMVNVIYMLLLVFAVIALWKLPPGTPILDGVMLGVIGFLVYGPQMLVGALAVDAGGKYAAATASGFTGFWGYLGSIASGVGTGLIVDRFGWNGGFIFFVVAAILGTLLFLATGPTAVKAKKPV